MTLFPLFLRDIETGVRVDFQIKCTLTPVLLKPHAAYTALGSAAEARALLDEALSDDDLAAIRAYLQQQRTWSHDDFRATVEAKTRRFAGIRPTHRPPKPTSPDK